LAYLKLAERIVAQNHVISYAVGSGAPQPLPFGSRCLARPEPAIIVGLRPVPKTFSQKMEIGGFVCKELGLFLANVKTEKQGS